MTLPRLTALAAGGGCACKLDQTALGTALAGLPVPDDPALVTGIGDDAAVWRDPHDPTRWLVVTTDFFTPLVDDATTWGRIAAVNAASDVWAMGGRPLLAVAIAGWPDAVDPRLLAATLRGGVEAARAGGWTVAGGHTIRSAEPLYGQAVVGLLDRPPVTLDGALPGDALVLTKALGTGIVLHAAQQAPVAAHLPGGALHDAVATAVESMTTTNARAAQLLVDADVHAMTDVTGFGLLGHLHRLCVASDVGAVVARAAVPVLPGARDLLARGHVTGGTRTNLAHARDVAGVVGADADLLLLADAQTSGGLLAALDPDRAAEVVTALRAEGHAAAVVGEIRPSGLVVD